LSQISLLLEANFGRGIAPYQRVGHDLEAISGVRCAPTTPEISNRVMKCACTSPGWAKSLELIVMWVNEWYMIASHTMGVPARSKLFARNLLVRGGGIFLASYLSCNPTQLKSRLSTALQSGTACRGYLGTKKITRRHGFPGIIQIQERYRSRTRPKRAHYPDKYQGSMHASPGPEARGSHEPTSYMYTLSSLQMHHVLDGSYARHTHVHKPAYGTHKAILA
jgi:hypothetical protein